MSFTSWKPDDENELHVLRVQTPDVCLHMLSWIKLDAAGCLDVFVHLADAVGCLVFCLWLENTVVPDLKFKSDLSNFWKFNYYKTGSLTWGDANFSRDV